MAQMPLVLVFLALAGRLTPRQITLGFISSIMAAALLVALLHRDAPPEEAISQQVLIEIFVLGHLAAILAFSVAVVRGDYWWLTLVGLATIIYFAIGMLPPGK